MVTALWNWGSLIMPATVTLVLILFIFIKSGIGTGFDLNFRLFKGLGEGGIHRERGGAVEAYWAHNPGVGGSKPLPATSFY